MSAPALPDLSGHFGRYGGRFVPEALVRALDELDAAYRSAKADPEFQAEFAGLLRDYAGMPSLLYRAERLCAAVGAEVLLKREDLNHTGAHKVRNVLGQALLAKRMGKPRVIAETGAGQHGVASATAAALLDLECVVYMGEMDTERQALNVARMRMLGATVVPVTNGSRTLKDAINEALRDWVANVDSTHYLLGTAAGPHPFPEIVRDFVGGIGVEARRAVPGAARRGCPTRWRPASAAAPTRSASSTRSSPDDGRAAVRLRGRRRRRRDRPARGVDHRRLGGRAARRPDVRAAGRRRPDRRVALDLGRAWTTRASARSTPGCTTPAGPRYEPVTDAEAMAAFQLLCRTEGIIPAIESAHALAGAARIVPPLRAELGREPTIVVNLSGRGDKDVHTAGRLLRHPRRRRDLVPGENA